MQKRAVHWAGTEATDHLKGWAFWMNNPSTVDQLKRTRSGKPKTESPFLDSHFLVLGSAGQRQTGRAQENNRGAQNRSPAMRAAGACTTTVGKQCR